MSRSSSDGGMVTLLLLGGLGAAAYYAYAQGWLSSLFGGTATTTAPVIAPSPAPTVAALVVPAGENTSYYGGNVPTNPATPVIALPVIPATFPVGSVGAKMVAQLVAQGQTQAQATATVQAALASTGGAAINSLAGVGRVVIRGPERTRIVFPRRGAVINLPSNYHRRTA